MVESQPSSVQPVCETPKDRPPSGVKADIKATNDLFAELWTEALENHKAKTGVDIQDRRNDFVQLFDDCEDSGDALAVLEDLPLFKKPGARTSWMKIKDSLKKLLDVVIVLNTLAAEVGNVVCHYFDMTSISCPSLKYLKGPSSLWENDLRRNGSPFEGT